MVLIGMGFSEDIMYDMAMKDIMTVFPEFDGWQRMQVPAGKNNEKVFSFSRRLRGKLEKGIAWVSFSPEITPEISSGFSDIDKKIPNCSKKLLLVPRSTLVHSLSPEITVKEMKVFGYEDGQLVWLTKKKNSVNFSHRPAIAA